LSIYSAASVGRARLNGARSKRRPRASAPLLE
jgi:hypothetical protein